MNSQENENSNFNRLDLSHNQLLQPQPSQQQLRIPVPVVPRQQTESMTKDEQFSKSVIGVGGRSNNNTIPSVHRPEQERHRGPHPSQIRMSAPRKEPTAHSQQANDHPQQQQQQQQQRQKHVVVILQSSLSKNKTPSTTRTAESTAVPSNSDPESNVSHERIGTLPTPINADITLNLPVATNRVVRSSGLPPTPTSPSSSLLQLPFLYTSPLNSLQQLLALPSLQQQPPAFKDCDYDQSPTELYQLIEQKQWKLILQKFDEVDDDDVNCADNDGNSSKGDGITVNESTENRETNASIRKQAAMWIVRKESNGRLKWRILPLHAAIIFRAPHSVIEAVIQSHPASASQKDDQGMLPLHLAMKNFNLQYNNSGMLSAAVSASVSVQPSISMQQLAVNITSVWRTVEELLIAYPPGIFGRDRKGRTPLQVGQQTIKKNYHHQHDKTSNISSSRHGTTLHQQQQEMMQSALSVLQQYEEIYSAAGDRGNIRTPISAQLDQSAVVAPSTIHVSPDESQQQTNHQQQQQHDAVLLLQQKHLETLKMLRTMFQKNHTEECEKYKQQHDIIQQQLNDSVRRERQLQMELDAARRELQQHEQKRL